MRSLIAAIKFLLFIALLVSFFARALFLYPFYLRKPHKFRKYLVRNTSFHAWILKNILNLHIKVIGSDCFQKRDDGVGYLIISNHMSYLDVVALLCLYPLSFVTSVEVRNMPVLGQICQMGGCLFVERRSRNNLKGEVGEISEALLHGDDVVIFPEGTSTNGEGLLHFRHPLFKGAMNAKASVLPLCINYTWLDGQKVDQSNRDKVCWYGKMAFLGHFFELLKLKEIKMSVTMSEAITTDVEVKLTAFELAAVVEKEVAHHYRPLKPWQMNSEAVTLPMVGEESPVRF